MSIPYEGTQDILFHRGAQNNTGKINNYHEELIGNSTAKLDELHINQNKANDTTDSNYDLSYYFHHSSSISTVSSAEEQFSNNNYRRGRSLSICSTLSINATSQPQLLPSPKTPPPPSTPHQEGFNIVSDENKVQYYKKHSDKSSKKAYQFFGEQVKLDIPIKEIKREGLKTLLHSNVPLGYFLYHLLDEYSSENLFFYLAVDNYQSHNFANHSERQQVANKIKNAYLTRNSELEVNLEDRVYRNIMQALDLQLNTHQSKGNEFTTGKKHVFSLLNVSYHRFRTSNIWEIMESKCSDLSASNKQRSQALVTNLLLSHVKRKHRDTLTFRLVHSFCRIYLPVGYDSRLSIYSSSHQGNKIAEPYSSVLPPPSATTTRTSISTSTSTSTATSNRRNRSKSMGNDSKKHHGFISSKLDIFKLSRR